MSQSEIAMTLKIEEWRDIDGYNGDYQVSNTGRVRSREYGDLYPSGV